MNVIDGGKKVNVTIKDIARETGLGIATISSYLNGNNVREANKIAIQECIERLGYLRNDYARGLKTKRSRTIGVLVPELDNLFSMTIVSQMSQILRDNGYGVIVCESKTDRSKEKQSIEFLVSKMVDGLIVLPISDDKELYKLPIARKISTVIIDRLTDEKSLPHVIINNRDISKQACKRLCDYGHENIAIITGDESIYTSKERRQGYIAALEEKDIYNSKYVFTGDLTPSDGYQLMKKIINDYSEITAIFVTNYELTIGALMAISESGKRLYDDYSVIGFDALDLSQIISPRLTIVNQPTADIGRTAAEIIVANIEGTVTINQDSILLAEIIDGDSIFNCNNN